LKLYGIASTGAQIPGPGYPAN